ncbi:MAG: choice-of-anchor tandem repeat GloVer-containing protein [Candidatus Korobacteraceae bacterium]
MRGTRFSIVWKATLTIFCVALFVRSTWAADQETVIYSFSRYYSADGANPYGGVIFDAAGNLYGTTTSGGISNQALRRYGTVFELSPSAGGGWTETVLHAFGMGTDGRYPRGSLVSDLAGNIYGTTQGGGIYGYGTVFELSPGAGGAWTEKVLYSFGNGTDGQDPIAGVIMDGAGNLYGTTAEGGIYNNCYDGLSCGTVFELSPQAGGGWTEKVLYSFGDGTDGQNPWSGLIMDRVGNLYGTTAQGGIYNNCYEGLACGTVFELSPQGGGVWTETVLHSFGNGTDGQRPLVGVVMDGNGNLYGTTDSGGLYNNCDYGFGAGCGTVFKLSPMVGGGWAETVLHNFGNGMDGQNPDACLIFDGAGNLYGTTTSGGVNSLGTVFELSPAAGGDWMETVLHSFGNGTDGVLPYAGVTLDASGNIYGTTSGGGIHATGTVFEVTP